MTAILLTSTASCVSGEAVPGAPDAVRSLRDQGHRLRFVTNNTTRARSALAGELQSIGFDLESEEITTTPLAAGKLLQGKRVLALVMSSIRDDLAQYVELVEDGADAVLLGGADESEETAEVFSYDRLNLAYAELREGVRLVCLTRTSGGRRTEGRTRLGRVVAGLSTRRASSRDRRQADSNTSRPRWPRWRRPHRGGHGRGRRRG
jgi:ribonucleotide monophosphatase NagD (HAD superfamily)